MNTRYEQVLINRTATIKQALERINSLHGLPLTLFVTEGKGALCGTLTDGDIRRGLLSGASLEEQVTRVMHRDFRFLKQDMECASVFREARAAGIAVLPVLDDEGHISEIVDLRTTRALLPLDAVLMAGGRGERLRPLTEKVPKPLLPVGGKPIIDHNVEALQHCGIENIHVTVNYLHEQIEKHFADRAATADRVPVKCVAEPAPLGTFGSIGLVSGLTHANVLVMNSDLLTTIDFEKMFEQHISSGASLTMAVTTYTVSVPYAIVKTREDRVESFQEKPTYTYFVNAGIYIVRRDKLAAISGEERVDATDFIDFLLAKGDKVTYFPIDGTWIDIGSPDDYALACSKAANQ